MMLYECIVRYMGSDTRAQMLSTERLVEAATSATGLDDFGDDDWREGLERLVQALVDEAALNEIGSIAAFKELKYLLMARLGVVASHTRKCPLPT